MFTPKQPAAVNIKQLLPFKVIIKGEPVPVVPMHGETPVAGPHNTSALLEVSLNTIFEPLAFNISKSCVGVVVPIPKLPPFIKLQPTESILIFSTDPPANILKIGLSKFEPVFALGQITAIK